MSINMIIRDEKINGELCDGGFNYRQWIDLIHVLSFDEFQSTGNAAGDLLFSIAIPAGKYFCIVNLSLLSLSAATSFKVVQSDNAGLGGVEVVKYMMDSQVYGGGSYNFVNCPQVAIDNRNGSTTVYCLVYIPFNRAGVGNNNAIGKWFHGNLCYLLE